VAAMQRSAKGWKTNISAGGTAELYSIEDELAEMSVKATKILGLEYSGVDILRSTENDQIYIVELNSTPGWQGLQTVTKTSISKLLIDYIVSKIAV
jgi:ribosomal protein S6--L-glutamate ligase